MTATIGLVLDCRDPQALDHGTNWILLSDPEGNEFCVCDGGAGAG